MQQESVFQQINHRPHNEWRQYHAQAALDKASARHCHRQQQGACNHEEEVAVHRHQHSIDRTGDRRRVIIGVVLADGGVDENDQQAGQDAQDIQIRNALPLF